MKSIFPTCLIFTLLTVVSAGCAPEVEIIKVRLVQRPESLTNQPGAASSAEPILADWLTADSQLADCLSYYKSGRYDSCRAEVENHLAKNPADWRAHYLLALVELKADDFDGAERCLQAALRFSPADQKLRAIVYLGLGLTLERRGDAGLSKQHYLMALNLDPGLLEAREGIDRLTTLTSAGDQ